MCDLKVFCGQFFHISIGREKGSLARRNLFVHMSLSSFTYIVLCGTAVGCTAKGTKQSNPTTAGQQRTSNWFGGNFQGTPSTTED